MTDGGAFIYLMNTTFIQKINYLRFKQTNVIKTDLPKTY